MFIRLFALLVAVSAPVAQAAGIRPRLVPPPRTVILKIAPGARVTLLSAPGGEQVLTLGHLDEFGQPTTLSVSREKDGWAGVTDSYLGNGHLGWVRLSDPALRPTSTGWSLVVERGAHRLLVRYDGRPRASFIVGVGKASTPTPLGSFAVSDKLNGAAFSPVYGCCILALSAVQPHPPAGWAGQARMAIHGTDEPGSIGQDWSDGCVQVGYSDLRWLMDRVPAGTPVRIEA